LRAGTADDRRVVVQRVRGWDRLVARCRTLPLDEALGAGAAPDASAALSLRARALIGYPMRRQLAADLRSLVAMAWDPSPARHGWGPACRLRLRPATEPLLALAGDLDADRPVNARGVALVRLLLADGAGPVYGLAGEPIDTLLGAIAEARNALRPRGLPEARRGTTDRR